MPEMQFDAEGELKALIAAHEAKVTELQSEMARSVQNATAQMESLISKYLTQAAPPVVVKEPAQPIAVWKEKDGERYLVMNEAAVKLQQKALDGLAEVLPELQKLLPKQPAKATALRSVGG